MRFLKQIAYGSIYLIAFVLIGLGVYRIYFYETPTCFDNIQNQDELNVDCDGSCVTCEIKNAKLVTGNTDVLPAGQGRVTLLTKIENPINYNATFEYKIDVIGSFGTLLNSISGESSINPKSVRYIVVPGITFNEGDISRAIIEITNANWTEESGKELFSVEIRNQKTVITENETKITGEIFNGSLDLVKRVKITALLTDSQNNILSVSAVEVVNIGVSEERFFTVFFPSIEGLELVSSPIRTRIFSEVVPSL